MAQIPSDRLGELCGSVSAPFSTMAGDDSGELVLATPACQAESSERYQMSMEDIAVADRFQNDLRNWANAELDVIQQSNSAGKLEILQGAAGVLRVLQSRVHSIMKAIIEPDRKNSANWVKLQDDAELQQLLKREATCRICQRIVADGIVHLEDCDHLVCRDCLMPSLTSLALPYHSRITCPVAECEMSVAMFVCKTVLNPVEFDELDRAGLDAILGEDGFIRCPSCAMIFGKQVGDVLQPEQDPVKAINGSDMSSVALRLRAEHRYKCNCGCEWCDLCDTVPYHNGFDCSQFKTYSTSKVCRFCSVRLTDANKEKRKTRSSNHFLDDVCNSTECGAKARRSCTKTLDCRHSCTGVVGEDVCPPCLRCPDAQNQIMADDFCNICWVDTLASSPSIRLGCGHSFHESCTIAKIGKRWTGSRISFGYLTCPLCQQEIEHPSLGHLIRQENELKEKITDLAIIRLELDDISTIDEITEPGRKYYQRPKQYALDKFAYYLCFRCQKPYFGGRRQCDDVLGNNQRFNAEELVCGACSSNTERCRKHGTDFIEFKCRFCCDVAAWFCGGQTHYCDQCHSRSNYNESYPCPGPEKCPLGVLHPANGAAEFALGCALCRTQK